MKTALLPWSGFSEVSQDGQSITLRRFSGNFPLPSHATQSWLADNTSRIRTGAVVDVETTGLDRKNDAVIEIGIRKFRYDGVTGEIQDPGRPLSQEISELTGLTDEDLRGKKIDWQRVNELLSKVDLVVAHNASFDRPFIDRHAESSRNRLWACSFRQVDWDTKGFPSSKLEILCLYHGFFTNAHRAQNDVDALLCLLSFQDRKSGKSYLHELVSRADQPYIKVIAAGSPFESKDLLKTRGYRWDANARVWQKMILSSQLDAEVSWLEASVYRGGFRGVTQEIPALDNFKE
jgi:DNA polymerase III subunit epsilon